MSKHVSMLCLGFEPEKQVIDESAELGMEPLRLNRRRMHDSLVTMQHYDKCALKLGKLLRH